MRFGQNCWKRAKCSVRMGRPLVCVRKTAGGLQQTQVSLQVLNKRRSSLRGGEGREGCLRRDAARLGRQSGLFQHGGCNRLQRLQAPRTPSAQCAVCIVLLLTGNITVVVQPAPQSFKQPTHFVHHPSRRHADTELSARVSMPALCSTNSCHSQPIRQHSTWSHPVLMRLPDTKLPRCSVWFICGGY